jgi:hypothetical protein
MQNKNGEFFVSRGTGASAKVANAGTLTLARIRILEKEKVDWSLMNNAI